MLDALQQVFYVTAPLEGEAGTYPWFGFLFLCICQPFIRSCYHPVALISPDSNNLDLDAFS